MANINALRAEVAGLTGSDRPMGLVLSKSLELIVSVRKDGIAAPDLGYAIEALKSELAVSVKFDKNKSDLLRRVVYGIIGELGGMVTELIDNREEEKTELTEEEPVEENQPGMQIQEDVPIDNGNVDTDLHLEAVPQPDDELQLLAVKNEPLDPFMQSIVNAMNGAENGEPLDQMLPEPPEQQLQHVQQPLQPVQLEHADDTTNTEMVATPQYVQPDTTKTSDADTTSKSGRKRKSVSYKERSDDENEEKEEEEEKGEFADRTTPKRHKSQVTVDKVERMYGCNVCSRTFSRVYEHAMHMRTHTGEKRFDCNQCEKNFTLRTNLHAHVRNVHGIKPHECDTCNERFDMLPQLKKHWQSSGHKLETKQ